MDKKRRGREREGGMKRDSKEEGGEKEKVGEREGAKPQFIQFEFGLKQRRLVFMMKEKKKVIRTSIFFE